jgi:hypothetical protein
MATVHIVQADVAPVEPDDTAEVGEREENDRVLDGAHNVAEDDHMADVVMVEELVSRIFWVILMQLLRASSQVRLQRHLELLHCDQVSGLYEAVDFDEEYESRCLGQAVDPVKGYETDDVHCQRTICVPLRDVD